MTDKPDDDLTASAREYTAEALATGNTDFLDAKADEWMAETDVQRMFNAIASVFEKWAPQDAMDRFRESLGAIGHQCFVEGAFRAWSEISDQHKDDERALLASPLITDAERIIRERAGMMPTTAGVDAGEAWLARLAALREGGG